MSATVATATIRKELTDLTADEKERDEANSALRTFILSDEFLTEKNEFLKLTSELESKLVTLEETAATPSPNIPQTKPPAENGNGEESQRRQLTLPEMAAAAQSERQTAFSYSRAMVLCVLLIVSGLLTVTKQLPPTWFVAILAGSLALLFFDNLKSMIMSVIEKEEEAETTGIASLDWIVEQFTWIRETYTSAYMLIHVQTSKAENLPDHFKLPGIDPALYDRRKYFETTLPTDFLERIDRIIVRCKKDVWVRKQTLINAITITGSPAGAAR